jgi:hypothetical protein
MGTLTIDGPATINLGTGGALAFANSNSIDWASGTLDITGDFVPGSSIRFGTGPDGLSNAQLSLITAPGITNAGLDQDGYLTAGAPSYADWIAGFEVGGMSGPEDDFDLDGLGNALENFLGTDPTAFSSGPVAGSLSGGGFLFSHPQSSAPASDIAAAYLWSKDLVTFHGNGEADGAGTTVTITPSPNDPEAGTTTVTAAVSGTATDRLFMVVEAVLTPPLISEDFETDDGGFTVVTTEGSDWERGTPDSSSLGGTVTTGNDDSTGCWGTDLGPDGIYAIPTTTSLRSPVIDLTDVTAAELTFAEAIDLDNGDTAEVNIIDDTTDTVIASAIYTPTDNNINTADWNPANNDTAITIPAAALGQAVRIEWKFNGLGGSTSDFLGWYIDDVLLITP